SGFTQGSGTTITVNAKPYALSGLMPNTTYDFYVKTACNPTWSTVESFATLCAVPTNLIATNASLVSTDVDLTWTENGTATSWEIEYGTTGFTQGTGTTLIVNSNPYTLTGLIAGTTYDFYVRTICGIGNTSPWSSATTVTIDGNCSIEYDEIQKLLASDAAANDEFGRSVSISGDRAIVGARYNDDNGSNSGSAYIFELQNGTWVETQKLLASDAATYDYFGLSVSISGDRAIVGAPYNDDNGSKSGSAYIFGEIIIAPTAMSAPNLSETTADLSWTAGGLESDWNIEWKAGADFTPGDNQEDGSTSVMTTPAYSMTGLTGTTTYYVYYQSSCGGEDSEWVGPYTFMTIAPLPVELTYFTAKAENANNLLQWQTASEENNSHFEVERSTDGINFETIGQVAGNGTTFETSNYSFVDEQPELVSYYRLRQVDFDGNYEYSKIEVVERNQIGNTQVTLYPIPVRDVLMIDYESTTAETMTITIVDVTGRVVMTREFTAAKGENTYRLDMTTFVAGTYFVQIKSSVGVNTNTIIKQ
ncbi:MAG: fibronectin type III domain-containing protein, partial [Saprospiraceae bacterium]